VPPITFEGDDTPMGPIPAVGAHSEAILNELGYDESTIETWRAAAMI
jgi:itaconate CoA-transferase